MFLGVDFAGLALNSDRSNFRELCEYLDPPKVCRKLAVLAISRGFGHNYLGPVGGLLGAGGQLLQGFHGHFRVTQGLEGSGGAVGAQNLLSLP